MYICFIDSGVSYSNTISPSPSPCPSPPPPAHKRTQKKIFLSRHPGSYELLVLRTGSSGIPHAYGWVIFYRRSSPNSELDPKTTLTIPQHHGQPTIDVSISNSSFQYYEKLFRTVLYLVEKELPFCKLESLNE